MLVLVVVLVVSVTLVMLVVLTRKIAEHEWLNLRSRQGPKFDQTH